MAADRGEGRRDGGANLLEVRELSISFHTYAGEVSAVRNVDFHLDRGEVIAIVGESGSGKSVSTQAILGLTPILPGEIRSGRILFEGEDLLRYDERRMSEICGSRISMIFQDPMTSLNPTMKVGNQIREVLHQHDLSMVKYISDRVGVMYLGRLVEVATKHELFGNPQHPYTQALLSSIPIPDPRIERSRKEIAIRGEIPSPLAAIAGCAFKTRCPHVASECDRMEQVLKDTGDGHLVMCTRYP